VAASAFKIASLRDFTGGLNLHADQFTLAPNESPDLLNVDIDERGGVRMRGGSDNFGTSSPGTLNSLWAYYDSGSTAQVMGNDTTAGNVVYGTGGGWTTAYTDAANKTLVKTAATFNDLCYIQDGTAVARKWNGTTKTDLGTTFVDNLAAPTGGNMPKAKLIASHSGYVWVANTNEAGTAYRNRVRWSHPNRAEDWRTNDYIDVNIGQDGDEIKAIVPDGDRLLVFKKYSTWAIYGTDVDSFFVQQVSTSVGTQSAYSVCRTPYGTFFWNVGDGVYLAAGNKIEWVFDRIKPTVDSTDIDMTGNVFLRWLGRRLWVTVEWGTGRNALVFDPAIGRNGAWTRYDFNATLLLHFMPSTGPVPLVFNSSNYLQQVDMLSTYTDTLIEGGAANHISSYYRTSWVDGGMPAIVKRWSRTRTIVLANVESELPLAIFTNYDPNQPRRTLSISVTGGSGTLWGSSTWGGGLWTAASNTYDIEKNVGAGSATSVQYKVSGPATNTPWGVDAFVATYRPKRIR
jgi:hypothetical protein